MATLVLLPENTIRGVHKQELMISVGWSWQVESRSLNLVSKKWSIFGVFYQLMASYNISNFKLISPKEILLSNPTSLHCNHSVLHIRSACTIYHLDSRLGANRTTFVCIINMLNNVISKLQTSQFLSTQNSNCRLPKGTNSTVSMLLLALSINSKVCRSSHPTS